MKTLEFSSRFQMDEAAADVLSTVLVARPSAVIALPTGRTPLGLYACLHTRQPRGLVDFRSARYFNLDEFEGKGPEDEGSYAAFLARHVFGPLGVPTSHVRLLKGDAADLDAECRAYEAAIAAAGGLDMAILGLGRNGHIAFNEPGDDWDLGTHRVALTSMTRAAQGGIYACAADVPPHGLTMGVSTPLSARKLLLLVSGAGKGTALEALLSGRPDPAWPVTALAGHPDLTVLCDLSALEP